MGMYTEVFFRAEVSAAYAKIASNPSMSAQDMWFKLKAWLEMMDA